MFVFIFTSVDIASKTTEENEKLKKQLREYEQQLHEQAKIDPRHLYDSERYCWLGTACMPE